MVPKSESERPAAIYHEIDPARAGQRIDNYLMTALKGVPRSHVYRLVRSGQVRVNSGRVGPAYRIKAGDRVRIPPVERGQLRTRRIDPAGLDWLEARIAYEDARVLVLDKPAGLAVHGGSGIELGCIEMLRSLRPQSPGLELAHRLDRETSGCLLIAKRRSVLHTLHALLRDRRIEKRYLALVAGAWPRKLRTVAAPLDVTKAGAQARVRVGVDGKEAQTEFVPLKRFGRSATLVAVRLETGRTHQIRVHAAHAGHAVVGDERYAPARVNRQFETLGLRRMFLHAATLSFVWPDTGEPFGLGVPLPRELNEFLASLERVES